MIKNLFSRGKDVPPVSVLVVSDDTEVLTSLNEILTANGFIVYSVAGGAAAASVLDDIAMPDVFIGDFIHPETDGKDFLGENPDTVRKNFFATCFILDGYPRG